MITKHGIYQCDYCGGKAGDFYTDSGNHIDCQDLHDLREAARDVILQRGGFGELQGMVCSRVALDRLAAVLERTAHE